MRMTKNREIVLNEFKKSNKPLSAEDIAANLKNSKMDLSTIYRSITYFDSNNLLLRFHFNNKSYYFLNTKTHSHYFICTNCLKMETISCNLKETIEDLTNNKHFTITNHELNIYGLCDICSQL